MQEIDIAVERDRLDAFGGPDREHSSFTPTQKAISYSMTSLLTTGGIRGSKVRVGGAFHPRSFNMGISREVFHDTDGFSTMRFGEDVEFSVRMMKRGYRVALIPNAWVYHKRRTDFKKFFKQVHNSGIARINITLRHPQTLKLTHFFPAAFTTYLLLAGLYALTQPLGWYALVLPALYTAGLFVESTVKYRQPGLGIRCVMAAYVQLVGYGTGFMRGILWRIILHKPEQGAFEKTFYS
jgi:GT2 family glycosyltransferase